MNCTAFAVRDFSTANTAFTLFMATDDLCSLGGDGEWQAFASVGRMGDVRLWPRLSPDYSSPFNNERLLGLRTAKPYALMLIDLQENTELETVGALLPFEWFAVRTRPRHEKVVTAQLETSGVETFLPLSRQVRSWSDRRKLVDFPLFPGYVFVRTSWATQDRVRVFQVRGVIGFVGPNNQATPIPAPQIEAVRSLLETQIECRPHPYLNAGQRVRIRNGALQGLEGILVRIASDHSLVVSVDLIHRSVAIRLEGYDVESL